MNFSLLQSFLAVARHGSFTAAAREMFITQPAISQHIQALEEELGVILFARQGKGVMLTEEGRELQKNAEAMVLAMEAAKSHIQERSALKRGQLDIATTEVLNYILPPVLMDFKKRYRGIDLFHHSHRAANVLAMVADGRASFGIAHKPGIVPSALSSRFIHEERLVLAAPAWHHLGNKKSVRPEDLRREAVVLRESGTLSRSLAAEWLGRNNLPEHFIVVNSMSAMRQLVLSGCLAFIPHCVVKHGIEDERIIPLKIDGPYSNMTYQYYLYTLKGCGLSSASGAFLELLAASGLLTAGENINDCLT